MLPDSASSLLAAQKWINDFMEYDDEESHEVSNNVIAFLKKVRYEF
ncbi:hypothetical protein [Microcoleus sp. OTE_8_concoct_300]